MASPKVLYTAADLERLDPDTGQLPMRLQPDDIFTAEDVLPGFRCRVGDLFPRRRR